MKVFVDFVQACYAFLRFIPSKIYTICMFYTLALLEGFLFVLYLNVFVFVAMFSAFISVVFSRDKDILELPPREYTASFVLRCIKYD